MKTIRLTRGLVTLVDNEDHDRLRQFKWYAQRGFNTYYAARYVDGQCVLMHSVILGILGADHRNGIGLDNRRQNLRPSTQSQNGANSFHKDNTSGFKGVCYLARCKSKPWKAEIKHMGKRMHLGYFPTAELASAAYRAKALEIYGEFARFERPVLDPVLRHLQGDHNSDAGKPRPTEGAEP